MGGSRRRKDKFRTKVSIKPKKTIFSRSKMPLEILGGREDMEAKLGNQ
jgi:hypothetical protein